MFQCCRPLLHSQDDWTWKWLEAQMYFSMNQIMLVILFQSNFLYSFIYLFADVLAWINIYIFPFSKMHFPDSTRNAKYVSRVWQSNAIFPEAASVQGETYLDLTRWNLPFLLCFDFLFVRFFFYWGAFSWSAQQSHNSFQDSTLFHPRCSLE